MADGLDILLEGIKTIGAPLVSGFIGFFASFWATRAQLKAKLSELREQNAFNARRQLFELYKERQAKDEEQVREIGKWLGTLVGQVTADMTDESSAQALDLRHEVIRRTAGQLPMWLRQTKDDMDRHGLAGTEPYQKLLGYLSQVQERGICTSTLRNDILTVTDVMYCLEACRRLIWSAQFDDMFKPYLKP